MYIAYQYRAAFPPDASNSGEVLTISVIKKLIVQDLVDIITKQSNLTELSDICQNVNYFGTDSGWSLDTIINDNEISIKSNNTENYYKKYVTVSTLADTMTDVSGFTTIINPDKSITYTDAENVISMNLVLQLRDDSNTLCTQSKTKPLKIYANGGILHIHVNEHNLMMSSINGSKNKYSSPIGITDIESHDILHESFPRFVFFTCNTWDYVSPLSPTPLYCTRKPSTTTYATYTSGNEYDVEIYDKVGGNLKFYNPDSASNTWYYGNHVYANDKNSSNYIFGGSLSELGNFYALPKQTIAAKIYDEIESNGITYIIWPIKNDDFTTDYMRLLIHKG